MIFLIFLSFFSLWVYLGFINVKFGNFQEEIARTSFMGGFKVMFFQESFELILVSGLPEINSGQILEIRFHEFHEWGEASSAVIKGQ